MKMLFAALAALVSLASVSAEACPRTCSIYVGGVCGRDCGGYGHRHYGHGHGMRTAYGHGFRAQPIYRGTVTVYRGTVLVPRGTVFIQR